MLFEPHRTEILAAQAEVVCAMKRLEAATGRKVESIEIQRDDITTIDDVRPRYLQRIAISLKPLVDLTWS